MKSLNEYEISFFGLKEGVHQFKYEIENEFFDAFDYDEFLNSNVDVVLDFEKKSTLLELHFDAKGEVEVLCDLSGEAYKQPIEGSLDLVVKFGEEFNDDNEEILILPHGEHQVNIAQYIYELIVLAVPLKRIHPGVKDGTLKSEVLDKLQSLEDKEKENNDIDPRWDELKKLLIDKNN